MLATSRLAKVIAGMHAGICSMKLLNKMLFVFKLAATFRAHLHEPHTLLLFCSDTKWPMTIHVVLLK